MNPPPSILASESQQIFFIPQASLAFASVTTNTNFASIHFYVSPTLTSRTPGPCRGELGASTSAPCRPPRLGVYWTSSPQNPNNLMWHRTCSPKLQQPLLEADQVSPSWSHLSQQLWVNGIHRLVCDLYWHKHWWFSFIGIKSA